jgi:hypothetical protein
LLTQAPGEYIPDPSRAPHDSRREFIEQRHDAHNPHDTPTCHPVTRSQAPEHLCAGSALDQSGGPHGVRGRLIFRSLRLTVSM